MAIGLCPQTVHPHVGGEHCLCFGWCGGLGGSSPRGWGTPYSSRILKTTSRFIPTWVGNTIRRGRCPGWLPVHPHVGGEHLPYSRTMWSPAGSSPRGWGTRSPGGLCRRWDRFIPTWVGNTLACSRAAFRWAVHPHVGGEHPPDPPLDLDNHGSSPRGWGTRVIQPVSAIGGRFIPTWVGNTQMAQEHTAGARFIPTWVGNTPVIVLDNVQFSVHPHVGGEHGRPTSQMVKCSVHPHVGGEHRNVRPGQTIIGGSSPRGWGTRELVTRVPKDLRFIPTWVGNTSTARTGSSITTVHPHVGGEHTGFDNVF